MDLSRKGRKPRLERRNAAKHIDYEATSSSLWMEGSSESLYTRSLDLSDLTSFRIEGTEGELDRICWSLGLSGPEDFAIPASAWEARKARSSSDLLPRSRLNQLNSAEEDEEVKQKEESEVGGELRERVLDSVGIMAITELMRNECSESVGRCIAGGGGGIRGARPPVLKPPPSMRLPVIDNGCSTWDLFRDFALGDVRSSTVVEGGNSSDNDGDDLEGGQEGDGFAVKGEADENVVKTVETDKILESCSCSFTTSNDDDSSSTATEPSPNAGSSFTFTLTDWDKGGLLGRGTFGSVYEGISKDGFFFAVKEVSLLDQGSRGKQSISQLEQEIYFLSKFEHQNIVRYYGAVKDESTLYIFLELVTKGSLMSLYQKYCLRDSQVSAYTRQILHGLKYLHDQNVVHRDIKCGNILVDVTGSVKLADFGLAKATKLNDVLSCKGTAAWMAPEVVNRKNQGYGLPADIWSLGCTVLEMLTRLIPYSELESQMQALFRIGKGVPPSVPDSLSSEARDFILQCLQVSPSDRPTAAQLLDHPFVKKHNPTTSGAASPYNHGMRN